MAAARFGLPAALAGLAAGILVADVAPALASTAIPPLGGAAVVLALVAVAVGGRAGGAAVLTCVLLAAAGAGSWRQAAAVAPAGAASVATLVDGTEHGVIATVVDDPRPRGDRVQMVLGDVVATDGGRAVALADRLLLWLPRGVAIESGDRLRVAARIELPEDFDGFAYREYLARQRIGGIARANGAEVVGASGGPGAWLGAVRNVLLGGLNAVVPEPEAALGAGILLGVRASIAPEINDAFARAGLTHVVAISGWNIAIVAALVAALARPLERRAGRWAGAALVVATVGGYVLLTGATPSVVRAALMAGALLVARLGGSRAHAASALGLAALIMLLAAPSLLWDVGFQLSLLATGGLIWFGGPIERRLSGWPGVVREPVALTLAAQVTTLPVILVNFERLSLVAPLANVLVVPFVPVAMLFSAVASVAGVLATAWPLPGVSDAVTWLTGGAAWLALRTIVTLGTLVASVPHASVDVSVPAPLAAAWLPVVALATWALGGGAGSAPAGEAAPRPATRTGAAIRRWLRPVPLGAALVIVLACITVGSLPDGRLHLTVLDIGQGDAILVETPSGATALVDGGPDPELTLRRMGANLPFFHRRVDLVVLSHPHQDHVAGLVDVMDRFRTGALLHAGIGFENAAYERLLADATADARIAVAIARTGQVIRLDGATTLEVLYPADADAAATLPEGDINNGSIVLLLRHGGFDALLTGDAERPVEERLVRRGLVPAVEVLKVGHHGSESSTTPQLLAAARPAVAVISAGVDNEYGHPAARTLDALAAVSGLTVLRTDLHGDVEIVTDGHRYRVRTDAGWSGWRPVLGSADGATIEACPSQTDQRHAASWRTRSCPTASSSTRRASPAWPWRLRDSLPRRASPWTERSSRRPRCSTTSTSSRSAGPGASTGSSARAGWRPPATRSSQCRSPPTP